MKGTLRICGLGVHPPRETTLEALRALEQAKTAFCDLEDGEALEWLKRFRPDLRRPRGAAEVARAARAGETALAVWGHPRFSSALARGAEELCRKAKIPCEVLGAISPIASAFARSISFLGGDYGYQGIQACSLELILSRPELIAERLPLVAYAEGGNARDWKALGALLLKKYPAKHRVRLDRPGDAQDRELALGSVDFAALKRAVLLIPPKLGSASRR